MKLDDTDPRGCEVCGEPYNYEGTGLCGPCATGEAATYGEGEYTGGDDE